MISLIMAFARPQKGRILVAGRDLGSMRLRDYRAHMGVVLQDNFLFDGTITDNIAFSKPGATMDEIRAVAHVAHCDEFIAEFPDKFDTIVGERGVKLSGGQRQRIAIARAILADPKILILDEATSSLDSESEQEIRDGLRALRTGRTTFVIAHRLSTIQSADQILVLEHGEIVERGRHAELLARNGRYKQLYDKQYQIERDQFINPGEDFTGPEAAVTHADRRLRRGCLLAGDRRAVVGHPPLARDILAVDDHLDDRFAAVGRGDESCDLVPRDRHGVHRERRDPVAVDRTGVAAAVLLVDARGRRHRVALRGEIDRVRADGIDVLRRVRRGGDRRSRAGGVRRLVLPDCAWWRAAPHWRRSPRRRG